MVLLAGSPWLSVPVNRPKASSTSRVWAPSPSSRACSFRAQMATKEG